MQKMMPLTPSAASSNEEEKEIKAYESILIFHMWDRPQIAFDKTKKNSDSGANISYFLSKLQSIEESYAKDLLKLVKSTPPAPSDRFREGKTLCNAFHAMLALIHDRGKNHESISEFLKNYIKTHDPAESDSTLKHPSKQFKKESEENLQNFLASSKQLEKVTKNMQQFKEKIQGRLPTDKMQDWDKYVPQKDQKKYTALRDELTQLQMAHHVRKTVYQDNLNRALDGYQSLEYKRVDDLTDALLAAPEQYSKASCTMWKHAMTMMKTIKVVNKHADLMDYIKTVMSGIPCPWMESVTDGVGIQKNNDNPWGRQKVMKWKGMQRPQVDAKIQEQAKKDKLKFEKLLSQRKAKEDAAKKKAKEREEQIQKLMQEKQLAESKQNEIEKMSLQQQQQWAIMDKRREEEIAQLLLEKKRAEEEKMKLKHLLASEKQKALEKNGVPPPPSSPPPGTHKTKSSLSLTQQELEILAMSDIDFKTPIVLDNGSSYFKIGFSGEQAPSFVVPSVVATFPHPQSRVDNKLKSFTRKLKGAACQHLSIAFAEDTVVNPQVFSDSPQSWDDLEEMWTYLFELCEVDIRDHPILLTQPALPPLALKEKISEIFFEKFQVPCLYVATAPLLSAYAYGSSSGLVVDIGDSSAQVVPLMDGFLMDSHVRRAYHLGGHKDTERLSLFLEDMEKKTQLKLIPAGFNPTIAHLQIMVRSIKDRLAYCVQSSEDYSNILEVVDTVKGFLASPDSDPELNPSDADETSLPIELQKELVKCGEVLFNPKTILNDHDTSIVSVPEMVSEVVAKCDVDTRRTLLSNVYLSGGVTTMPGFPERFERELKQNIPHAEYIKVFNSERRFAAWKGGSVLASLEGFQDSWVFEEEYNDKNNDI